MDAWSKDSVADFAADQALLALCREKEAAIAAGVAATPAAAAAAPVDAAVAASATAPASDAAPAPAPTPAFAVAASSVASSASSSSSSSSAPAAAAASSAAASSSAPSASSSPLVAISHQVDGSLLEGGGQVLRNAMAYSALLNLPMRVFSIRAGRPSGGGLKAQHLKGLHLVEEMTAGKLKDAHIASRSIEFIPGKGGRTQLQNPRHEADAQGRPVLCFEADTQTAGATGLLIQVSLPVALFLPAPVKLTLRGGTNATMAPVIDYSMLVFAPVMKKLFALDFEFHLVQRGFFPRGGGVVHVHTHPVQSIQAVDLTQRGTIVRFSGLALVTHKLPVHIAQRMVDTSVKLLRRDAALRNVDMDIQPSQSSEQQSPIGDGVSLILVAHTSTGCMLGASAVGERGLPAEEVAAKAANQLLANIDAGGCVDEYLQGQPQQSQRTFACLSEARSTFVPLLTHPCFALRLLSSPLLDQLIIFMALAHGTSTIKTGPLTLHTRTCLFWAACFCGAKISVSPAKGNSTWQNPEPSDCNETFLIRIQGIGYNSRFRK